MFLFLLGLCGGALLGYWLGKSNASNSPVQSFAQPARNHRVVKPDDPVSNLMSEMQIGVQLLAEDQRNCNLRQAIRIKADRQNLTHFSHSSHPR